MMRSKNTVTAFAPATIANVGAAFDVLGFALETPGDTVTVSRSNASGIHIHAITNCSTQLPLAADQNTASVAISAMISALSPETHTALGLSVQGIDVTINKGLPIGSGLGSSSASSVAAIVAANRLLGGPFSREELLPFAMEGERTACGTAHADNVAPALLGGFTLIRSYSPLEVIPLPTPGSMIVAVVSPDVEVKTSDARRILKGTVPLVDAISQWGNVAALVTGIFRNDVPLIGASLEDKIIEPARAALIPGFHQLKKAAIEAGALGFAISGSGPSLFAVCDSEQGADRVIRVLQETCERNGINSSGFRSKVNPTGAFIIEDESNAAYLDQ